MEINYRQMMNMTGDERIDELCKPPVQPISTIESDEDYRKEKMLRRMEINISCGFKNPRIPIIFPGA